MGGRDVWAGDKWSVVLGLGGWVFELHHWPWSDKIR